MSKRRLITTFLIGSLDCANYTIPYMREYASRCTADFLEVKWLYDFDGRFHGNPCYSCVQQLVNFAQQDYYDELLMLDIDVLPLPWAPSLFDMEGDVLCSPDQAWPVKDERYHSWISRNYPDSSEIDAEGPYFNAGVLLFRRDAARKLDLDPPYPNDFANDQDFLNMRVAEAGLSVNWLGEDFNQRHVGGGCMQTLRDANILHFCGCKHEAKRYYEFLKQ